MTQPPAALRRSSRRRTWLWLVVALVLGQAHAGSTARSLTADAERTLEQQGPRAALVLFTGALAAARAERDADTAQRALRGVGACQRRLGAYREALGAFDEAIALARASGSGLDEGKALSQLGLVHWELGNYTDAEQQFRRAIDIARGAKDQHLEASALNNMGLVYDERGRYTDSIRSYERALALYARDPLPRGESDTLSNIGGVHLLLGHFGQALNYYERALAIDRARHDAPAIGTDRGNIGLALQGLGRYLEAAASLEQAIDSARISGQKVDEAFWLKSSAGVQLSLGRYDLALEMHRHALALYEQSGSRGEYLEARADFGELLLYLGDLAGAEEEFRQALELAREIEHHRGETQALLRLGDLQRTRHQDGASIASYRAALARAEAVDDQARGAEALVRLAAALAGSGQRDEAERLAVRAIEESGQSMLPWIGIRARLELAALAESSGNTEEAREGFRQALESAKRLGDPELLWRSRFGLGRALASSGDVDAAIAELEQAVVVIEGVRSRLQQRRFRSGYLNDKYEVYVELVRLLLKVGKVQRAFSVSEDLRSQAFHDMRLQPALVDMRDPELTERENSLRERVAALQSGLDREQGMPADQRRDGALTAFSVELARAERAYTALLDEAGGLKLRRFAAPDEAELRKHLRPDSALLEFVVGNRGLTVFVLDANSLRAVHIELRRSELRARIELLRELILDPTSDAWRLPARALAEKLIDPLHASGWLHGVQQLYIVPDAELNYLPFAVLQVGDDGDLRPLVDRTVLRLLPSAAMLVTSGAEERTAEPRLLALAPEAAKLRHAGAEARAVADLHGRHAEVWTGAAATEHRFKREAGSFDLLHVATHGEFNSLNPAFSALDLEAGGGEDGKLRVQEITQLRLRAELIALSACDTALGSGYFSDVPVGNEFIGLTRAFLQAGSRGVLSSLWAVDDRFTSRFMVDFYRATPRLGFAGALAAAQRRLVQAGGAYAHPYYWAPYVLIGGADEAGTSGKVAASSVSYRGAGPAGLQGATRAPEE